MKDLSPERWQQIDALFEAALEQPAEQRTAFLEQACNGDDELFNEVNALLDSDIEAEEQIGDSVTVFAEPLLHDLEADIAGTLDGDAEHMVGPYHLLEEIGRGGMGRVYLAERADGSFKHRVALKLVKRGMDTDEILRRFRYERQILAALHHPHIARLYDGGRASDGRPYLVMEYVDGQTIDVFCDAKQLPVSERLRLFVTVCEAVRYAHQNLIVHRDLKPSNILVTADGQVKLLDFGIAKLLSEEDSTLSVPMTQTGMRVMTPEYAAPEQVRGEAVTTATDVYALGIVLYELLTGRRPVEAAGNSLLEAAQAILDTEPLRPSTAVARSVERRHRNGATETTTPEAVSASRATTIERLQRQLRGDLDTILLKALKKEPERRYASAEAFVEDIKRHLAGLPVQARPDTVGYRLRKFVRRHRLGVAAASAFVVLLAASFVALAVQQAATAHERDIARQERDKAEEVATFLEDLFDASNPFLQERIDTLRIRDLLAHGLNRVHNELQDQPLVQAQMLNTIGRAYDRMGLSDEAEPLLRQALETRRAQLGDANTEVAQSLDDLGWTLYNLGHNEEAEALAREGLATRRALYDGPHEDIAESMRTLGTILAARGQLDEAEPLMREALAMYRQVLGNDDVEVATSLSTLAVLLWDQSHYEEADVLLRESLALRRRLYGDNHPSVAIGLNNLAYLLRDVGEYAEAETFIREALAINRTVFKGAHPHVADNLTLLGSVLRNQHKYDEAEPVFREAVAMNRQLYGDVHPSLAVSLSTYAALLSAKEDYDAAERIQREALSVARKAHGDVHFATAINTTKLAGILQARGALNRALPLYREGLALTAQVLPTDHLYVALARNSLASCLLDLKRYAEAEPLLLESYRTLIDTQGAENRFTQSTIRYLVTLYEAWNKPDEATRYRALVAEPSS